MKVITVSPEEDLQAVLDRAPENARIRLLPGTYRQKLVIRTPGLTITGSGKECTRLVWDDYARKRDQLGAEWNTFRTYTLAVCADGFLYNMVRAIVGTCVYASHGKLEPEEIPHLLEIGDRRLTGPTMPPQGLYMNRIWYEGEVGEMMQR